MIQAGVENMGQNHKQNIHVNYSMLLAMVSPNREYESSQVWLTAKD
jgi:hypothetical protein